MQKPVKSLAGFCIFKKKYLTAKQTAIIYFAIKEFPTLQI